MQQKFKITLAVLLPVVIVALAALFVCSLDSEALEKMSLASIFVVLVNVFFLFACIPFAAAFLVLEIVLFTAKKQKRVALALLIIMSIFLPVLGVILVADFMMYLTYSVLFLAVALATGAAYIAAYVMCILYFIQCRKAPTYYAAAFPRAY